MSVLEVFSQSCIVYLFPHWVRENCLTRTQFLVEYRLKKYNIE